MYDGEEYSSKFNWANFYLRILRYANSIYLQGQDKVKLSLQILDIELQNIIDAQLWAKENGSSQNVLELINEFPNAGYKILSLRLHPRIHIDWFNSGLDAAKS